jgi:hypothetical protein
MNRRLFIAGSCVGLPLLGRAGEAPVREIKIVPREGWKAKPPQSAYIPQKQLHITLHHTAIKFSEKQDPTAQLRSIQAFHMGKDLKWPDIAYHYLIDWKGVIYKGRPDDARGDTMTDYDLQDHVLACMLGNFEEQQPTAGHLEAMTDVVAFLVQKYNVPDANIRTHRDLANTACPGKHFYEIWKKGGLRAEAQRRAGAYRYKVVGG